MSGIGQKPHGKFKPHVGADDGDVGCGAGNEEGMSESAEIDFALNCFVFYKKR